MRCNFGSPRKTGTIRLLLAGSVLTLALAGCQTASQGGPTYTGSIGDTAILSPSDLTPDQAEAAIQRWGKAYGSNEKDKVAAMNYAAALRAAQQTGQAAAVMRKAAIYHPEDREVLAAFGKALAADGQFREALSTIKQAQRSDNPDWQLLSTEGGILDSLNQHDEARKLYQQALVLAPGEAQILNNLGLSYLLTNDLDKAETYLRQAVAAPSATLKTRQNLALVLRLRGKTAEADQIGGPATARAAAPAPQTVRQEDTWAELAKSG